MKYFKKLPPIYKFIVFLIVYMTAVVIGYANQLPNDKRRLIPAERNRTIWFEKNTIYWVNLSYPSDKRYHGKYNIAHGDAFLSWLKDKHRDLRFCSRVKFVDGSIYIRGKKNTVELRGKYVIKRMVEKYELEKP